MITQEDIFEIETVVKGILREKISAKIKNIEIKQYGVAEYDVVEKFLTDIISLSYNNNSTEIASNEIYELQSQMPWLKPDKMEILKRVSFSALNFKEEVNLFNTMSEMIELGLDKERIITKIRSIV